MGHIGQLPRKSSFSPNRIYVNVLRKFQSNIRELEGALTPIVAYADLRGLPMTPD
jgi:chromosomal replication initiation ATPase DnaA